MSCDTSFDRSNSRMSTSSTTSAALSSGILQIPENLYPKLESIAPLIEFQSNLNMWLEKHNLVSLYDVPEHERFAMRDHIVNHFCGEISDILNRKKKCKGDTSSYAILQSGLWVFRDAVSKGSILESFLFQLVNSNIYELDLTSVLQNRYQTLRSIVRTVQFILTKLEETQHTLIMSHDSPLTERILYDVNS